MRCTISALYFSEVDYDGCELSPKTGQLKRRFDDFQYGLGVLSCFLVRERITVEAAYLVRLLCRVTREHLNP